MKKNEFKNIIKEEIKNILEDNNADPFYTNKKLLDSAITDELISTLEYFHTYYSEVSFKKTKEFANAIRVLKYIKGNINKYQKIR